MRKGEEDMGRTFDNLGFNNYYTTKSKYAKKQELLTDFYRVWYDTFGWDQLLDRLPWRASKIVAGRQPIKNYESKVDWKGIFFCWNRWVV